MRVVLDLPTLGEVAGRIATAFAAHKGVEMTEDDDLVVAQATVDALYFMFDRAEFARSVQTDLSELDLAEQLMGGTMDEIAAAQEAAYDADDLDKEVR